ncbi:PaaI family thioesterase [Pseudonocardia nigra]|uniref:PaaI family thioesterase n=1 Tax=Pseudonocardia nigra TaxID=1921578 RepID=UPI001C5FFC2C|nr:PaaI family thioesterase [Pseudonocardia nigra]
MRNMQRWLGDGGMPLIEAVGAQFDGYGTSESGMAFAEAGWRPTALACNPHGTVQGGVHGVLLDAAMNFAVNVGLEAPDRTRASLEMKTETMRPARAEDLLRVRGEVVRMARQVAYAEARVTDAAGSLLSRATATFLLHRAPRAVDEGQGRQRG